MADSPYTPETVTFGQSGSVVSLAWTQNGTEKYINIFDDRITVYKNGSALFTLRP